MRSAVLVHSPLLTASSWDGLRAVLDAAGWRVVVPDLVPLTEATSFHAAVCEAAAAGVEGPAVVVGHSRAGPYLPGIVEAIGAERTDVVFLDARLPYPGRSWLGELEPERRAWLRDVAVSGRLPAWNTWFDDLPADPRVARVLRDLPELPWSVVSEVLPELGRAWESARRIYLQLSPAYQVTADQAQRDGYQVGRLDTDHLAMVTQPTAVAELLSAALTRVEE